MPMKSILIEDAKERKRKRLVVTDKMLWDTLIKNVTQKMRYKETLKIIRKSDEWEITKVSEFADMVEYESHGVTWDEFNAQQERERREKEMREERLRKIKEIRRMQAEREARQVEENEHEYEFWGESLKLTHCAGDNGVNAVVTGFVNKATMLRYASLKRGDLLTGVNDVPLLDMLYKDIVYELSKATMPMRLSILSGRIDFVQRRAREYHDMLEAEVEVEDPFEMIWYEDKRKENDARALLVAAKNNMLDDVKVRCSMEGADVNRRTVDGQAPLHVAAAEGHMGVIRILINHGADPNVQDDNGMTPLHYAAQRGRSQLIRYLVAKGADIQVADQQGRSPLLYACSSGFRDAGQLLVRRGCDVFTYDKDWAWSALHWAARRGDCVLVRTLLTVGCNLYQRSVRGLTAMEVALHHRRKGPAYELRQWHIQAPSQQLLPEIDFGGLDEPPPDYEPPGAEDFELPSGPAVTARSLDSGRVTARVAFNKPTLEQGDDDSDDEQDRQARRNRPGFKAGKGLGHAERGEVGSLAAARSPEAILKRINAGGAGGASAESEAEVGLNTIKDPCWSLDPDRFDAFAGELHIGDYRSSRKEFAVSRGFTAIVTMLDSRNPLPPHMDWLSEDAPDPPIPPPERRSKIIARKRRSTIATRLMEGRNARRMSQLRAMAEAKEQMQQAAERLGVGAGAGAGHDSDSDDAYNSGGEEAELGEEDDGAYSSDDEAENKRVFVKPAHLVVRARDVDTVQGWGEMLPHVPSIAAFVHTQLREPAPPYSNDDDPALSAKPGGKVLIQCATGNKQGVIAAMAYMIVKMGFAPWKALHVVAYARPQIEPPITAVRGLCVLAERLIKREARRRERRFAELRMASLAGV